MAHWRPPADIRVKTLALAVRDGRFLAEDVTDDAGRLVGLRPPGGTMEFGERREETLIREMAEELGAAIAITGAWQVFEAIYRHEGALGHEIVFAVPIRFAEERFYREDAVPFHEDDGTLCHARWWRLDDMRAAGLALFPAGLEAVLEPLLAGG